MEEPVLLGQLVCDGEFDHHHPGLDRGELRSEQCHEPLPREASAYTGFELGIVRDSLHGGRHNGHTTELLIDCELDGALRAVLVGMLREGER